MKEKLFNYYQKIFEFILNPQLPEWAIIFKIIFIVFGIGFALFTLWGIFFTDFLKLAFLEDLIEFLSFKPIEKKKFIEKWEKIKARFKEGIEPEVKLGILELVELMEEVLKNQGYKGKIEEQISQLLKEEFPNLNEVKKIIEMKNGIIEDPNFKIELSSSEIISTAEQFFKYLQIL